MRSHRALTTLEMIVVLGLLAAVGVFATWSTRPGVGDGARRLAASLAQVRHVALASGETIPGVCAGTGVHGLLDVRVGKVRWPPRGLLFTPDGLPRTCDGVGVGNTTILLEHRGRQAAVIVSSLGRVRWELR